MKIELNLDPQTIEALKQSALERGTTVEGLISALAAHDRMDAFARGTEGTVGETNEEFIERMAADIPDGGVQFRQSLANRRAIEEDPDPIRLAEFEHSQPD